MLNPTDTVEMSGSQRVKLMTELRKREWSVRAAGVVLLAASGALAWMLIVDPLGTVPGAERIWKGAPMILVAACLGCFGALVLILKRFSLGALIVSTVLGAAAASGAQAYVHTIQDTEQASLSHTRCPRRRSRRFSTPRGNR